MVIHCIFFFIFFYKINFFYDFLSSKFYFFEITHVNVNQLFKKIVKLSTNTADFYQKYSNVWSFNNKSFEFKVSFDYCSVNKNFFFYFFYTFLLFFLIKKKIYLIINSCVSFYFIFLFFILFF